MPVEVLNDPALAFPTDVRVAVLNKNDAANILRFDGVDHDFPPHEAVIIDCETAYALFAIETRTPPGNPIRIRRDKHAGKVGTGNSHYDECLVKYGAANTAQGRAWFENFDFKLVKTTRKMAAKDFELIK
jgi:hypothetical protein